MQKQERSYSFGSPVNLPFAEAVEATKDALQDEGFGILCEIDVRDTLKQRLGVDFLPYKILGACNPGLANQALNVELDIGLLLPCNVIVYEVGDKSMVKAVDPVEMLGIVDNPLLEPIAREAKERLERVVQRVAGYPVYRRRRYDSY